MFLFTFIKKLLVGSTVAFQYATKSTASTLTGLLILSSIVSGATYYAHAQSALTTSYDVTNEQQMHLAVNLTTTQTTGIIIAAPKRNAANHIFATTTGGVLRIRFGAYQEDISFTGATVNATTYQITLSGVTRNLCPQVTRAYVSCGAGRQWGIGAIVELNNDARLFNLKANIDRANTFTALQTFGSGITLSGSGYSLGLPRLTTAERDALTGLNGGELVYNHTTGLVNQYVAGAWSAVGTDATANASETVAGKMQVTTLANLRSLTSTGSTGALNALGLQWLVKNGTGTVTAGRIPQLNQNGALSLSLGGLGSPISTGSGVLVTTGSGSRAITGSASGDFIRFNSKLFPVATQFTPTVTTKTVYSDSGNSTATGATSTAVFTFDTHEYTIPANDLVNGICYRFTGVISVVFNGSYTYTPGANLGAGVINATAISGTSGTRALYQQSIICGTASAGASVSVDMFTHATMMTATPISIIHIGGFTVPTNGTLRFRLNGVFGTSDGSNSATMKYGTIEKISSTSF